MEGHGDENIRTVTLPALPDLKEGEIGPLAAGDWITLITPLMKDLSATSSAWWEVVLTEAVGCYDRWLRSDPMTKLNLMPRLPVACQQQPWLRLEQRAQAMLMEALPESLKMEILTTRATSSVQVIFKVLVRYQPGGLGERAHLLKQLVEVRVPTSVGEMVTQLQMWRRWLRRAQELRVNVPDATLLMGALDKLSQPRGKVATQSAFRLSAIRANWMHGGCQANAGGSDRLRGGAPCGG